MKPFFLNVKVCDCDLYKNGSLQPISWLFSLLPPTPESLGKAEFVVKCSKRPLLYNIFIEKLTQNQS